MEFLEVRGHIALVPKGGCASIKGAWKANAHAPRSEMLACFMCAHVIQPRTSVGTSRGSALEAQSTVALESLVTHLLAKARKHKLRRSHDRQARTTKILENHCSTAPQVLQRLPRRFGCATDECALLPLNLHHHVANARTFDSEDAFDSPLHQMTLLRVFLINAKVVRDFPELRSEILVEISDSRDLSDWIATHTALHDSITTSHRQLSQIFLAHAHTAENTSTHEHTRGGLLQTAVTFEIRLGGSTHGS